MRKLLTMLLILAMFTAGMYMIKAEVNEVKASEANQEGATVEPGMLTLRVQSGSNADGSVKALRFVSSVNSLDYQRAGFEVNYDGAEQPIDYKIGTVYERIESVVNNTTDESYMEYKFSPKVVDTSSEYFMTAKLNVTGNEAKMYTVKAYVIPIGGTEADKVYGPSRCVCYNDGLSTVTYTNMSFVSSTDLDTTNEVEQITATSKLGTHTASVVGSDANASGGYNIHVRVDVDPDTLPSVTKFTFEDYGDTMFRNLYTVYSGTADNSWFMSYNIIDTKEFVIATSADLYGLAELAKSRNFDGKTIYLVSDIDINPNWTAPQSASATVTAPSYSWTSIGGSTYNFKGIFDGQMHTISGLYQQVSSVGGLFGVTDTGSWIQNLRVENSYFSYTNSSRTAISLGSICGDMRGSMQSVYSKATVVSKYGERVGGLVGVPNGANNTTVTISDCWFDGTVAQSGSLTSFAGGIAGRAMQGTVKISHCLNTGNVSSERGFAGGIIGGDQGAAVNLQDCLNTGTIASTSKICVGSLVGGTGASGTAAYTKYDLTDCYALDSTWNLINTNVATPTLEDVRELSQTDLQDKQGYKNTQLDFENFWAAQSNTYPALKSFVTDELSVEGVARIGWYKANTTATDYYIDSEAEFYGLAELVNGSVDYFFDQTIHLTDDLELNEVDTNTIQKWRSGEETPANVWTPIGTSGDIRFCGVFDGGKHKISGVYVNTTASQYVGLFGRCDNPAVIKDVYLTDSYIKHDNSGGYWTGSIVGMCYGGTLEGLYTNAIIETSAQQIGGIVGRMEGTIKECWFDGEIKSIKTSVAPLYMGGIVGGANSVSPHTSISITDCLNTGKMNFDVNLSGSSSLLGVGGIFGVTLGNLTSLTIQDCVSAGEINFTNNTYAHGIGMIIGFSSRDGIDCTFSNCYARNDVLSGVGADNTYKLIGKDLSSDKAAKNEFNNNATTCNSMSVASLEELVLTDWVARTNAVPIPSRFNGTSVAGN